MHQVIIALAATIVGLMTSATPINAAQAQLRPHQWPTAAWSRRSRFIRAIITGNIPMALLRLSTPCRPLSTPCHPLSTSCRPLSTSCRRHVRQAVANITTGMVKTASTPATTGPMSDHGRSRNARTQRTLRASEPRFCRGPQW